MGEADLEALFRDENWEYRAEAARNWYKLDELVNDPDYSVRIVVAQQNYGLDILINDPPLVRARSCCPSELWARCSCERP